MSVQFTCCECRRSIIAIVLDKPPEPPLCCECIALPGWHEDSKLAAVFDPDLARRQSSGAA